MDLKISTENQKFKVRVAGMVIHNGKLLVCKIMNNKFYCLPGGHCHLYETSQDAMLREMNEETGMEVKIDELSAFIENLFVSEKGEKFHELCYIYRLTPNNLPNEKAKDWTVVELDDGIYKNLDFKWIDLDKINDYDIRPSAIKQIINKKGINHIQIINEHVEFLN